MEKSDETRLIEDVPTPTVQLAGHSEEFQDWHLAEGRATAPISPPISLLSIRCSDCNPRAMLVRFHTEGLTNHGGLRMFVHKHGAVLFLVCPAILRALGRLTVPGWRVCEGSHALKSNGFFCLSGSTSSSSFSDLSAAGPGWQRLQPLGVLEALDSCSRWFASCCRRAASATGLQSSCLSLQTICEDSSIMYLRNYPLAHNVWPLI